LLGHPAKPQYDIVAAIAEVTPAINAMMTSELTKIASPLADVLPTGDALVEDIKKVEAAVVDEVEKVAAKVTKKAPAKKAAAVKKTTK
jgi:hypothetical protein